MDTENKKLWYVIQTYSGYENSVKISLEQRTKSMQMEDKIFQIVIPEEIQIETKKDGTKKEKLVKMYPGYVFLEIVVTDESWFVVRNTPGVTGFLGSSGGGTKPVPLHPDEMIPILKQCGLIEPAKLDASVGDTVTIRTGSFAGRQGVIDNIDTEKEIVTVLVEMFERNTPIDLKYEDVETL